MKCKIFMTRKYAPFTNSDKHQTFFFCKLNIMILIRAKLIANPIIEMSVHSGKLFGTHLRSATLDNSKFAMLQLRKKEANYDI
jgi:hypothetical protein